LLLHVRVARPVRDLDRSAVMYMRGLGLQRIGGFVDHDGFDGVMLGGPGLGLHFEFTFCRTHPVLPTPTPEDLVVFYLADSAEWQARCQAMLEAGFSEAAPFNPYWKSRGRTFQDPDGYLVVLEAGNWPPSEPTAALRPE
jgi:hypothetical protein